MAFLKGKLALVVLGTLLLGSAGALLGAKSAILPSTSAAQLAANGSNSGSNTTGTAPTATGIGSSTTIPGATPTDTSVPTATPTRVPPTPTPLPVPGQTLDLHGSVGIINQNQSTFVLNVRGGSYIVKVDSNTQWPGYAKSISGNPSPALATGMLAEVVGVYQGGGNLTASTVDAQPDN